MKKKTTEIHAHVRHLQCINKLFFFFQIYMPLGGDSDNNYYSYDELKGLEARMNFNTPITHSQPSIVDPKQTRHHISVVYSTSVPGTFL